MPEWNKPHHYDMTLAWDVDLEDWPGRSVPRSGVRSRRAPTAALPVPSAAQCARVAGTRWRSAVHSGGNAPVARHSGYCELWTWYPRNSREGGIFYKNHSKHVKNITFDNLGALKRQKIVYKLWLYTSSLRVVCVVEYKHHTRWTLRFKVIAYWCWVI